MASHSNQSDVTIRNKRFIDTTGIRDLLVPGDTVIDPPHFTTTIMLSALSSLTELKVLRRLRKSASRARLSHHSSNASMSTAQAGTTAVPMFESDAIHETPHNSATPSTSSTSSLPSASPANTTRSLVLDLRENFDNSGFGGTAPLVPTRKLPAQNPIHHPPDNGLPPIPFPSLRHDACDEFILPLDDHPDPLSIDQLLDTFISDGCKEEDLSCAQRASHHRSKTSSMLSAYRAQLAESRTHERVLKSALEMQKGITHREYLRAEQLAQNVSELQHELEKLKGKGRADGEPDGNGEDHQSNNKIFRIAEETKARTIRNVVRRAELLNEMLLRIASHVGKTVRSMTSSSDPSPVAAQGRYRESVRGPYQSEQEERDRQRRNQVNIEVLAERWGIEVVRRFLLELESGETAILECFIANVLVERCEEITTRFCDGPDDGDIDVFLTETWADIQASNDPEDSRTWLVLMNSHLRKRRRGDSGVMKDLYRLIEVSGVNRGSQEGARISAMLREKVKDVTRAVLEIKDMCVELVSATDIGVLNAARGTPYDPESMQELSEDEEWGVSNLGESVICSTGLGVIVDEGDTDVEMAQEVVLKTRVLLTERPGRK